MRIENTSNGEYHISMDGTENAEFRTILEGWLDALEYHEYKSRGYKNRNLFSLGIKGEFVGFWRKAQKLYASVWEAKILTGEGTQEVLMDTFGSVGLMLHALKEHSDKYNAGWRNNSGNKPTFGPGKTPPPGSWLGPAEGSGTSIGARIPGVGTEETDPMTGRLFCPMGGNHDFPYRAPGNGIPIACSKCGKVKP